MEVKIFCPLGSQCEEAKDGAIHRCAWYTKLMGNDPQTGKPVDDWGCAMAWTPILLIENASAVRSVAAAAESSRNVVAEALEGMPRSPALTSL